MGLDVVGFLDDHPDAPLSRGPDPVMWIGKLDRLDAIGDRPWIMGFGNLAFRDRVVHLLEQREIGRSAKTVVHPTAYVSPSARLGEGVYIGPRAVVHTRAAVHDHAIINTGAIIEHESIVGVNAHVAPGAVLAGGCRVGPGALIGIGARLLPMLSVGDGCIVGAGAVVVRSVVEGTVVGVPARPAKRPSP
jgi:UDP-perosamine 4-acetyltransferase